MNMSSDELVSAMLTKQTAEHADLPLEKLHPFAGHPYKVKDDDEMAALVESIRTQGILTPLVVKPMGQDNSR